jgi:mannose-6-phosphate isomerase-like protein (cupin superfamily)
MSDDTKKDERTVRPGFVKMRPQHGFRTSVELEKKLLKDVDPARRDPYLAMVANPDVSFWFLATGKETSPDKTGPMISYVSVKKGVDFPRHHHERTNAFIFIVKGRGRIVVDEETFPIEQGDCLLIEHHKVHEIWADEALDYLAIVHPTFIEPGTLDFVFT